MRRDRDLFIDLPEEDYEPAVGAGIRSIKAVGSNVVIAKFPPRQKSRGIYLSDEGSQRYRPDAGVVISSGDKEFTPGQTVLCRYWAGLHFSPYQSQKPEPIEASFSEPFKVAKGYTLILPDSPPERTLHLGDMELTQTGAVVGGDMPIGDRVLFKRQDEAKLKGFTEYSFHLIDGYLCVPTKNIVAQEIGSEFWCDYLQVVEPNDIFMVSERGEWRPTSKYALIERDMANEKGEILLTELGSRPYRYKAELRSSLADVGISENAKVIVDPDPNGTLFFKFSGINPNLQLVPRKNIWCAYA